MKKAISLLSLAFLLSLPEISSAAISFKTPTPANPPVISSSQPGEVQLASSKSKFPHPHRPPRPPRPPRGHRHSPSK